MLTSLVVLALAAAPGGAPGLTLALPGLNAVNLNPGEGELYAELVAQHFTQHGVKVMTARDLATVLGVERQKQLLGCAESSCLVEMTSALGADGVIAGDLGKLGDEYALNLKVLSSRDGSALALQNARAASVRDLPNVIEQTVRRLVQGLATSTNHPELLRDAATAKSSPVRALALIPGIAGVVAIGAGVALQVAAGNTFTDLSTHHYPEPQALDLKNSGRGLEAGGNAALIGGGVCLAAAVVMFIAGAPSAATPTVAVTPDGAVIGLVGVLP